MTQPAVKQPDILLVCVDCLRSDRLLDPAPSLNTLRGLLDQGALFSTTIAATTTTSPSIASILTGLYPVHHGILSLLGYKLGPDVTTLPQRLAQRGYRTAAHVTGPLTTELGLQRGFQDYLYRDKNRTLHTSWFDEIRSYLAGLGSPWMTFLHLWELHLPRFVDVDSSDGADLCDYDRALAHLDRRLGDLLTTVNRDNTLVIICGDHGESIAQDPLKKTLVRLGHNRHLRRPAQALGRLLDRTRAHLPFGPADHYAPGFHGQFEGHGFHVYDFLVKVPLLIAGPGIPAGKIINRQVSQVDIAPTILDVLDADWAGDGIHRGRSLLPLLDDPATADWDEVAFAQASGQVLEKQENWIIGLRTPKWKFARPWLEPHDQVELFDLQNDPRELTNVASANPAVTRELGEMLDCHLRGGSENRMTSQEQDSVAQRLRDLGYL